MSRTFRRCGKDGRLRHVSGLFDWVERPACDNTWRSRYVCLGGLKRDSQRRSRAWERLALARCVRDPGCHDDVVFADPRRISFWHYSIF